jgi:hypothetical protein
MSIKLNQLTSWIIFRFDILAHSRVWLGLGLSVGAGVLALFVEKYFNPPLFINLLCLASMPTVPILVLVAWATPLMRSITRFKSTPWVHVAAALVLAIYIAAANAWAHEQIEKVFHVGPDLLPVTESIMTLLYIPAALLPVASKLLFTIVLLSVSWVLVAILLSKRSWRAIGWPRLRFTLGFIFFAIWLQSSYGAIQKDLIRTTLSLGLELDFVRVNFCAETSDNLSMFFLPLEPGEELVYVPGPTLDVGNMRRMKCGPSPS